jgi:hypothetical protein
LKRDAGYANSRKGVGCFNMGRMADWSRSFLAVFTILPAAACFAGAQTASTGPIELESPRDFQVFQRQIKASGTVAVAGRALARCDGAEGRVSGKSPFGELAGEWQRLTLDATSDAFQGNLRVPSGGWYRFELRLVEKGKTVASIEIPHIGIGEVFIVAGQSNATNYGEVRQQTRSAMVAAYSAEGWRLANDPQRGVQDRSSKGSFIPAFGDALFDELHVPIGVAAVGHGSTSVRQWLPGGSRFAVPPTMGKFVSQIGPDEWQCDGTLFEGMMKVVRRFGPGGFRALLWHQGESDAHQEPANEITADVYGRLLERVIQTSREQAGWNFPWFVARASYHSPSDPSCDPIRDVQKSLWGKGVALEGPDTDQLGAGYRQNGGTGVHFSDKGLQAHGRLWAEKVLVYLDHTLQ